MAALAPLPFCRPKSHAAFVQLSRTTEASWRDSNHSLVRGGALQHHAAPAPAPGGESRSAAPKMPACEMPLSALLSAPLPAKTQMGTSVQRRHASHLLATGPSAVSPSVAPSDSGAEGMPQAPLRERVACTRGLPENLRTECLERLDRVDKEIPERLRRRPSWTHDHEVSTSLDGRSFAESIAQSGFDDGFQEADANSELERLFEPPPEAQVPPNVAAASSVPDGIAPLRLPTHVGSSSVVDVGSPQPLPNPPVQARPREPRRRRELWTVGNRDLTAAASVWKSSHKAKSLGSVCMNSASPGRASDATRIAEPLIQKMSSVQSAPLLRMADSSTSPPLGTERTRRAIEQTKSGVADGGNVADNMSSAQSPPATRGVNSVLRTSLRYALQF